MVEEDQEVIVVIDMKEDIVQEVMIEEIIIEKEIILHQDVDVEDLKEDIKLIDFFNETSFHRSHK